MKSILFFSRFPVDESEKSDGEMQRVLLVDQLAQLEDYRRTYVHIRFRALRPRVIAIDDQSAVKVNILPLFSPFTWLKIISLSRRNQIAYFHSLHNYKFMWFLWPWLRNMQTVLDLHGAVPEENAFLEQPVRASIYAWLERHAMHRFDRFVSVSFGMMDHLILKYPFLSRSKFSLLPMIRSGAHPYDPAVEQEQRAILGLAPNTPVAIYAGNTQKWQNVDLMLDVIKKCGERIYIIILSGAIDDFKQRLNVLGIENVYIKHVHPEDLYKYYCVANYGFLLRDDNVVNNVSNPTKLVEYIKYGITPIVLTKNTSDLLPFKVDTLLNEKMSVAPLTAERSWKNIEIFGKYYLSEKFVLSQVIFGNQKLLSMFDAEADL